ncbi:MAG: hypothetical protein H0W09_07710 [Solirubrobacterales bacterium]|nr:hypothetical protein [Solirubrobacterales bacterium]
MSLVRSTIRGIAGLLLVVFLAVGVPMGWVWVGSQVQGGTSPTATAIVTVIAGLVVSYSLVGLIAAWLKGRGEEVDRSPTRATRGIAACETSGRLQPRPASSRTC